MSLAVQNPQELKEKGLHLFKDGQTEKAITTFEAAAEAFAGIANTVAQAEMLNNAGVARMQQRQWEQAEIKLKQAADCFAEAEDVNRQGQTIGNLGDVYAGMKRSQEAVLAYEQAAQLLGESGDNSRQSQVYRTLSLFHLKKGHWYQAMINMEHSLAARPHKGLSGWIFQKMVRFALSLAGMK